MSLNARTFGNEGDGTEPAHHALVPRERDLGKHKGEHLQEVDNHVADDEHCRSADFLTENVEHTVQAALQIGQKALKRCLIVCVRIRSGARSVIESG